VGGVFKTDVLVEVTSLVETVRAIPILRGWHATGWKPKCTLGFSGPLHEGRGGSTVGGGRASLFMD